MEHCGIRMVEVVNYVWHSRRGELLYISYLQFVLFRKAVSERRKHPELVQTRMWWMQNYME
eukprot:11216946-Prorocentrum_lima.AAC.1